MRNSPAVVNPYTQGGLRDNLSGPKAGAGFTPGASFGRQQNPSASKTVYRIRHQLPKPPAKKQKVAHDPEDTGEVVSRYFHPSQVGAVDATPAKGKGKARGHSASSPTFVPDSDEDREDRQLQYPPSRSRSRSPGPTLKLKTKAAANGVVQSSSPDPLDLIAQKSAGPHPFETPDAGPSRLPQDGWSTQRLRARHAQTKKTVGGDIEDDEVQELRVVDVDDRTSDIDVFSDDEDPLQRARATRNATPRGRHNIPPGVVKKNRSQYEGVGTMAVRERKGSPVRVGATNTRANPERDKVIPYINLNLLEQRKSGSAGGPSATGSAMANRTLVGGMMKRNGTTKVAPEPKKPRSRGLAADALPSIGGEEGCQLDPVATTPSGFAGTKGKPPMNALPLLAYSLGVDLTSKDDFTVVAWLSLQNAKSPRNTLILKLFEVNSKTSLIEFSLDRDFDSMEYTTDKKDQWPNDSVLLIKLQSTKGIRLKKQINFKPGDQHAQGHVTFRFLHPHANLNGSSYGELIAKLKSQIQDNSLLDSAGSKACWEAVENAAAMRASGTRTKKARSVAATAAASSSRVSPASASASATVSNSETASARGASERPSVPAPPRSKAYTSARKSARLQPRSPSPDLDEIALVYPPLGKGAVNITRGDLKRLDAGQYLNDTLIEFGLKLWQDGLRKTNPELADSVHVFNSFFYKMLSTDSINVTYPTVRKWTSKVDIFKKKYIIVPVNEHFHWYLIIIENPANMLHPPPPAHQAPFTRKRKRDSQANDDTPPEKDDKTADVPARELHHDDFKDEWERGGSSKQPSEAPEDGDRMHVDGEHRSECAVEDLLSSNISQSCTISEPSPSASTEVTKVDDLVLVYPCEEHMDVDVEAFVPPPVAEMETEIRKEAEKEKEEGDATPQKADKGGEKGSGETATARPSEEVVDAVMEESKEGQEANGDEKPNDLSAYTEFDPAKYPICTIFTFDSLGTGHPKAGERLSAYLRHEAVDKLKHPFDETCVGKYKKAPCPIQKNFCDCGLFVMAFVDAFMQDPEKASEAIRKGTKMTWWTEHEPDGDLREVFRGKTLELSDAWCTAKEAAKKDEEMAKAKALSTEKEKEKAREKEKETETEKTASKPASLVASDSDKGTGTGKGKAVEPAVVVDDSDADAGSDSDVQIVSTSSPKKKGPKPRPRARAKVLRMRG
ncbi:uncharacterized protein BXZ73DRAFT_103279 [Epithele typhae]|uniref:uncharacterized protein n=1 Tax=Epithele typhae TaxID=378194 RepID=UPI00200774E7|nr:uncharacterized protein BXZ73DRAFT_103279 [Epithele typhae]KAH9925397.1 hypothetical protein BXZ73DRAFT_103279 [Epithele typhae]